MQNAQQRNQNPALALPEETAEPPKNRHQNPLESGKPVSANQRGSSDPDRPVEKSTHSPTVIRRMPRNSWHE
jgi:hypothetical protein